MVTAQLASHRLFNAAEWDMDCGQAIRFIKKQAVRVIEILDAHAEQVDRLACQLLTNRRATPH